MIRWRPKRAQPPDLPPPEPEEPDASEALAEARRARETSEQGLAEVRDRWPEINRLGETHRRHRQENHFLAMFERATRVKGGGNGDSARG